MVKNIFFTLFFLGIAFTSLAQQKLNPNGMSYVVGPKPNSIVYNDSIFRGSKEFKHLFFRTGNSELIALYDKHQSNKIFGQAFGVVGVIGLIAGINQLSTNNGLGWALIGGGLAASITGGYLSMCSQRNLLMAVTLFNQQYNRAKRTAVGIGVNDKSAGIVYQF